MDERKIGFIQGVIYSASLLKQFKMGAEGLLDESNISGEEILKYGDEYDLKILGLIEDEDA